MKRSVTKSIGILSSTGLFLLNARQVFAQSQSWTGVCVSEKDETVATLQGFQCLMANVLASFLTFVGLAGFVMIIVASFQWMISSGDSQKIEKSKKTLTFAIIGIILALSSFVILNLIASFTGINTILNFSIPSSDTQW